MLKRVIFAGAASILISGVAHAADIVEPAAFDWTGPYVGLQGGYAWGDNDASAEQTGFVPPVGDFGDDVVLNGDDGSIDIDGWLGGAHAVDAVLDGGVDLFLHRAVVGPTSRHEQSSLAKAAILSPGP